MARTFPRDTELEHAIVSPGLGFKRGKLQRFERSSYSAIVVHTTGMGIHRKAKRLGLDPFGTTLKVFSQQTDASGHYVVGQAGQVAQIIPENIPAWHVGGKNSKKYNRARWWEKPQVAWWRERWPQFYTPRDLAGGRLWGLSDERFTCNGNTVGIEVVPPPDNGPWSAACWRTLGKLCWDISGRRDIALALETVLSHSDAHPFARSAKGKPWDPNPEQWSYERFAAVAGLPLMSGVGVQL